MQVLNPIVMLRIVLTVESFTAEALLPPYYSEGYNVYHSKYIFGLELAIQMLILIHLLP